MTVKSTIREIPLTKPEFDAAEAKAVADVLATGWVAQGPAVARFEAMFAARVLATHAVATSSCTTALHLALLLAGVGPSDEVICPSYTFIATANAIRYTGATAVFADIDPRTWNIDAEDALRRVTPRTKAIVPVHQVGLAADLDALRPFANRGLAIIEDAACAAGASYRGRPVGSHGHLACFSFHPRKAITTGEGGMLTTDDASLAERACRLRSHGASVNAFARHQAKGVVFENYDELGFNYRMSDVHAAIGIVQLQKLDALVAMRRAVADRYNAAFTTLPDLQLPATPAYALHTYQSYGIVLPRKGCRSRDEVLSALAEAGISARRGIPPIHLEPLYQGQTPPGTLPVTEDIAARTVFLPIYASLSEADQQRVIDAVFAAIAR